METNRDKQAELDQQGYINEVGVYEITHTATHESFHICDRLTKVSTVARPAHVQRKHIHWDNLQLIIDLQVISNKSTHMKSRHRQ